MSRILTKLATSQKFNFYLDFVLFPLAILIVISVTAITVGMGFGLFIVASSGIACIVLGIASNDQVRNWYQKKYRNQQ